MEFSPGIRGDNPAFGFAMWDGTPASGGAPQGGYYPSGPSAIPVGTPARPLLDYIQGRNRMENIGGASAGGSDGGSRGTTAQQGDGSQNQRGGQTLPPDPLAELEHWVKHNGLNAQTLDALRSAGCDNVQGLRYLRCEDMDRLGLPIIQRRILQKALGLSEPEVRPPQPPGQGGGVVSGLSSCLAGLGIGGSDPPVPLDAPSAGRNGYTMQLDRPTGKPDYHDIVDHLPCSVGVEEEEIVGGDGQTKILLRRGPQRVKLEKVTANQWNCANMVIMDRLYKDGKLGPWGIREYMNYTFVVNELAGRYQWQSVLSYDREYRQLQAREGFPWGAQVDHLSRVFLKEKLPEPANPKGASNRRGHRQSSVKDKNSLNVCGLYNSREQVCHFGADCKYAHICSECGKPHPKYEHGKAPRAAEPKNLS